MLPRLILTIRNTKVTWYHKAPVIALNTFPQKDGHPYSNILKEIQNTKPHPLKLTIRHLAIHLKGKVESLKLNNVE